MARKADVKGGNGDVIFDLENGIARKYLRNTSSVDKVQRFEKELKLLKQISNLKISNIVQVQNVYISSEKIQDSYIEMKKYDGSLYDIFEITRGNVKLSLKLILPIIKALYELSKCSPAIYHRDIKPDNILFEKENETYTLFLTDFGTCFLKDGSERITPEIMAIGPRMFIAPEYEVGRVENVDEKGDIFSIGKVIWCMINGVQDEFLLSNFWFVDEYNLQKRFTNNADMVNANVIIGSCLGTKPNDRCDYLSLILQIEGVIEERGMHAENDMKQRIALYQEKRKMELIEIKEKNRLLVNIFSQCYINALEILLNEYGDFELLQVLYKEYKNESKDGIDYTSINVENNSAHYLYSRTYDRIYISLNYNPAHGNDKYCNLTISYNISSPSVSRTFRVKFAENNTMVCEIDDDIELLNVATIIKMLNIIVEDYISE